MSIRNFRGISDMRMEDVPQANLVTGMNGVGKTSVLEAMFLACNPVAQQVAWLVVHRQHPPFRAATGIPPWRDLFRQSRHTANIELDVDSDIEPRQWSVSLTEREPTGAVPIALPSGAPLGLGAAPPAVPQATLRIQVRMDRAKSTPARWTSDLMWTSDNSLVALPTRKPPIPRRRVFGWPRQL